MVSQNIDYGDEKHVPWASTVFDNLIKGYQSSRLPAQMRQEEEKQRLLAEQLGLGNENQRVANEFQRPQLEQKLEKGNVDLESAKLRFQALPQELQDAMIKRALENQEKQLNVNALPEDIAQRQLKEKLANEKNQFDNYVQNKLGWSKEQADLAYKNAQTEKLKSEAQANQPIIPRDEQGNIITPPPNAINIAGRNDATQRYYQQDMEKRFNRGNTARQANDALDGILEIIDRNPKLNRSLAYILNNPNDEAFYNRFVSGLDEKTQTDIDLFRKYSDQLALYGSENAGARATNQLRQMYRNIKPGVKMTSGANRKLANEIKKENEHLIEDSKKIAPFLGGSYYIPPNARKSIRNEGNDDDDNQMVTLRNKTTGKTEVVTRAEAIKRGAIK